MFFFAIKTGKDTIFMVQKPIILALGRTGARCSRSFILGLRLRLLYWVDKNKNKKVKLVETEVKNCFILGEPYLVDSILVSDLHFNL